MVPTFNSGSLTKKQRIAKIVDDLLGWVIK